MLNDTNKLKYELPVELAAREPVELMSGSRDSSRLIIGFKNSDKIIDDYILNFHNYINPGDLIILNNSKTVSPIFYAYSEKYGEVKFHIKTKNEEGYVIYIRIRSDLQDGIISEKLFLSDKINVTVDKNINGEEFLCSFNCSQEDLYDYLLVHGEAVRSIYTRKKWSIAYYQNGIANKLGSFENPAANRHFSNRILRALRKKGVKIGYITLNCASVDTKIFEEFIEEHSVFKEYYEIPEETAELIRDTKLNGNKIFAVGTTVIRTLESCEYDNFKIVSPLKNYTDLYIYPGYNFKITDALITNFHGSMTSRLALSAAVIGTENIMNLYRHAIDEQYLFYEFGDANLLFM